MMSIKTGISRPQLKVEFKKSSKCHKIISISMDIICEWPQSQNAKNVRKFLFYEYGSPIFKCLIHWDVSQKVNKE